MVSLAAVIVGWLLPLAAFVLPMLLQYRYVSRFIPSLPRNPSRPGFEGASRIRATEWGERYPRLIAIGYGLILGTSMLSGRVLGVPRGLNDMEHFVAVRDAVMLGALVGSGVILAIVLARITVSHHRAGQWLARLGVSGVWHGTRRLRWPLRLLRSTADGAESLLAEARLPGGPAPSAEVADGFAAEIKRTVAQHKAIDVISPDGLDVLAMLSHSEENPLLGPDLSIRGAKIRLLLLPPQNGRTDPERRRLSCAEVALARLERSPEEHWRLLKHAFGVTKAWSEQHGVQIEMRFMENRPAFACLISGTRVWAHPWPNAKQLWIELQERLSSSSLAGGIKDYFATEWGCASAQLSIPLTDGATGSTIIRKGVEVPENETEPARA